MKIQAHYYASSPNGGTLEGSWPNGERFFLRVRFSLLEGGKINVEYVEKFGFAVDPLDSEKIEQQKGLRAILMLAAKTWGAKARFGRNPSKKEALTCIYS